MNVPMKRKEERSNAHERGFHVEGRKRAREPSEANAGKGRWSESASSGRYCTTSIGSLLQLDLQSKKHTRIDSVRYKLRLCSKSQITNITPKIYPRTCQADRVMFEVQFGSTPHRCEQHDCSPLSFISLYEKLSFLRASEVIGIRIEVSLEALNPKN
jgi:hypothetical protein